MSLESLIKMQSAGVRMIEEANTPRPGGVAQGAVLVTLDVTKEIGTAAVYWALGNVVRRGDNLKIVGIITHVSNPMGFRTRVDKNSWIGSNGVMLQHEFGVKRNELETIPHVKEWCDKAGVTLQIDVKAGYATKTIIVDEAKAIGAYHVVLDKSMKNDRKFFIDNLTCFVSRARNSGGVDTIRSFSVSSKLPPLVPTPSASALRSAAAQASAAQPIATTDSTTSMASLGSNHSNQSNHSGSSGSYIDIGPASSDGFLTQDSDLVSAAPTTGESLDDAPVYRPSIPLRATPLSSVEMIKPPGNGTIQRLTSETGYNAVNRKPALRKWLAEDEAQLQPLPDHTPLYDHHHNASFVNGRTHRILGTAPVVDQQQQQVPRPSTSAHLAPPSPANFRLSPGLAAAPSIVSLPAPPLSSMPSPPHSKLSQSLYKTVWMWTRSKEVMRAAVEVGWTTFIFTPDTKFMAPQWTSIEWIKPLFLEGGRFLNQDGKQVALLGQVYSGEQLDYLPAMMGGTDTVVINDLDWQIIPPEDVVAAFQGRRTHLFATANTASDAQVYLEALEVGMDGVVLHTDNISEIGALRDYLTKKKIEKERALEWAAAAEPLIVEVGELELGEPEQEQEPLGLTPETSMARSETSNGVHDRVDRVASSPRSDSNPLDRVSSSPRVMDLPVTRVSTTTTSTALALALPPPASPGLRLANATVKSIVSVGEGDRVSVDLCNLLNPGEAMLVGSLSKGMFLVHSEVQASNTSRKSFRVNAGPVHAYTGMAEGRTTYLAELESGGQVLAVDAKGNSRTVLVGRVSIESRPLVLIVVEVGGKSFSVMLQESDSVRLVIPAEHQRPGHEAIAVTKLQPGDMVVLRVEDTEA